MRTELANLNHSAVPFLSRAAVNLSWYDSISKTTTQLNTYNEWLRNANNYYNV